TFTAETAQARSTNLTTTASCSAGLRPASEWDRPAASFTRSTPKATMSSTEGPAPNGTWRKSQSNQVRRIGHGSFGFCAVQLCLDCAEHFDHARLEPARSSGTFHHRL